MHLIGRQQLYPLTDHGETKRWLTSWIAELKDAHWKSASDLLGQFPKVHVLTEEKFLFPVPKRSIAIEVFIAFPQGIALITALISSEAANEH